MLRAKTILPSFEFLFLLREKSGFSDIQSYILFETGNTLHF